MTNEEMEKTIGFILEQQSQFAINQQMLQESDIESAKRIERLEKVVANAYVDMRDRYNALVEAHTRTEESLVKLAEAQAHTDAKLAETNGKMSETDERLNALINTVERYISERRNGKSQG